MGFTSGLAIGILVVEKGVDKWVNGGVLLWGLAVEKYVLDFSRCAVKVLFGF